MRTIFASTVGSEGLAAIAGVAVDERSILRWAGEQPESVAYSYRQKLAWKTKTRGMQIDEFAPLSLVRDRRELYLAHRAFSILFISGAAPSGYGPYRPAAPDRLQAFIGKAMK